MAENKEGQEKTEPASAKRFQEARLRGQVSKSMDVTTATVLLFGGMSVFLFGGPLIDNYMQMMGHIFYNAPKIEINQQNTIHFFYSLAIFLSKFLLPIVIVAFFVVLIAETSQVGIKIATKKFTEGLNFKQIFNPLTGLKRVFFSARSIFELIKNIFKIIILGGIIYWVLWSHWEEVITIMERPFSEIGSFMASLSFEIVLKMGIAYIIIAIADSIFQKWKFKEDLKMTKHEVKEETKQTEGDPKIKGRLRQLMRQRIRRIMFKNASEADVVITNPEHYAVALKYDRENMAAPRVVAKGLDFLALRIREIAEENNVPIFEEPPLARTLYYSTEVNDEIPENLFKAVARILAFVYSIRNSVN